MNYPIKYAVLKLKVDGDPIHWYEEITKGFIVSKSKYASAEKAIPKYEATEKVASLNYSNFFR